MGFITAFGTGALTGILNEQSRNRDERAEMTKAAMERLDRAVTKREEQIEQRAQRMQQAQMLAQSQGGNPQDYMAALEAGTSFDTLLSGQVRRRGAAPAATAGLAGPNPNAPTTAAATGGTAGAVGQLHREESGGRMTPGIMGDGNRSFGPLQVQAGALTDVNRRHGTNYTPEQLADDPDLGKRVGEQYYGLQLERFGGDHRLAAAAYNGGPSRLSRVGLGGMPPQTQRYAGRVAAAAGQTGNVADARTNAATAQEPPAPIQESGSMTARAPVDMSGIPPNPDTSTRPTDTRRPPVLGETARGAMDFLFNRTDPARVGDDARRRYAGMRGMSPDQVAALERPLPRASFSGQGGFEMAPMSPQEEAKLGLQHRNALEIHRLDATERRETALETARIRRDEKRDQPLSSATTNALAMNLDRMLADDPRSPFRVGGTPDAPRLIPRALPTAPGYQQAIVKKADALVLAERIYREHPREGMLAAIQQAAIQSGLLPANEAPTPAPAPSRTTTPPPARTEGGTTTPAPQAPKRVNSLEEAQALPPGTPFITPDGRSKIR